jgi:hypothetical protein
LNDGAVSLPLTPVLNLNIPNISTETMSRPIRGVDALRQWNNFIAEDRRKNRPLNGSVIGQDFFRKPYESSVDFDQSANISEPYYYVQIVATNGPSAADEVYQALRKHLPDNTNLFREGGYYKVRIGPLVSSEEARQLASDMTQAAKAAL